MRARPTWYAAPMADPQKQQAPTETKFQILVKAVSWSSGWSVISALDLLIGVSERLLVLGAMLLLVFVVASLVWLNSDSLGNAKDIASAAKTVHDNWRAFIVVLFPLLYRVVRQFLDETEEVLGIKRRKQQDGPKSEDQVVHPPQSPTPHNQAPQQP